MKEMKNNPVCKLFGTELPIVCGGMAWCSGWRLAAAVSRAGALGVIGSGSMDAGLLREHIRRCREATDKPFGVNVPLQAPHVERIIDVVTEERVGAVITSPGNPASYTQRLHDAG